MSERVLSKTVSDFLGDLLFKLEEKAGESTYWENAQNFVFDNKDKVIMFLTDKQTNWLLKIKEDLEELR